MGRLWSFLLLGVEHLLALCMHTLCSYVLLLLCDNMISCFRFRYGGHFFMRVGPFFLGLSIFFIYSTYGFQCTWVLPRFAVAPVHCTVSDGGVIHCAPEVGALACHPGASRGPEGDPYNTINVVVLVRRSISFGIARGGKHSGSPAGAGRGRAVAGIGPPVSVAGVPARDEPVAGSICQTTGGGSGGAAHVPPVRHVSGDPRRPATFGGLGAEVCRLACAQGMMVASLETEPSLLRALQAGAMWTGARARKHQISDLAVCPYCGGRRVGHGRRPSR